ncbi:MAG TPA: hypothetical protein PKX86_02610 [Bacteroidia bacterium]|nr:hypothetical protein [Bacteroidia bacterium]
MNKKDIPQDHSALVNYIKELCYAVGEDGQYTTANSTGWDVKTNALNLAWQDIEQRIVTAYSQVKNREVSPILYYMELRLMDIGILSAYTGFWKWTIKRHLKPSVFVKLDNNALIFEIDVEDLKTEKFNADKF